MPYFKILAIVGEYRTYTVEAHDSDEATEFFQNGWEAYSYDVGDDVTEQPEIQQVWEA